MKHNSTKYRKRTTKRRLSKRRSISKQHNISKRRFSKRRYTRKYRMRGGTKTSVAIPASENPLPPQSSSQVSDANIKASSDQNNQVKTMQGGKRKRSGSKRSGSKRRAKYNQRGGVAAAIDCVSGCTPDASGYGCLPPVGCTAIPVLNNEDAQNLAKIGTNINNTTLGQGQYDGSTK